jgi:hypothetical protein
MLRSSGVYFVVLKSRFFRGFVLQIKAFGKSVFRNGKGVEYPG